MSNYIDRFCHNHLTTTPHNLRCLIPCAHTTLPSSSIVVQPPTENRPSGCCLSFNGGKDSTVIFHLLREALPERSVERCLLCPASLFALSSTPSVVSYHAAMSLTFSWNNRNIRFSGTAKLRWSTSRRSVTQCTVGRAIPHE